MRFYTKQHRYYCGIDLHARTMYLCVLNQQGEILLHRNMPCSPDFFLKAIAPYREDMAVAVECIFTWYWLADLCAQENIVFVLGHALYMKAIHGGKAKNDKIDAHMCFCAAGCCRWPMSIHKVMRCLGDLRCQLNSSPNGTHTRPSSARSRWRRLRNSRSSMLSSSSIMMSYPSMTKKFGCFPRVIASCASLLTPLMDRNTPRVNLDLPSTFSRNT